jgi:chemotaxis protein CheD
VGRAGDLPEGTEVTAAAQPRARRVEIAVCRRLVVGIGEFAIANRPDQVIVTHALGSCIAVCLFDPVAGVAAMLHFLLPEASINTERARHQPAAFADTGIPLLFRTAYQYGLDKKRTIVKIAGGAEVGDVSSASLRIGRRNALAAKHLMWRSGVLITSQDVGGHVARTVHLSARDGRVQIFNGREQIKEL